MQVIDSEGYLKVKLIGGPAGPFVPYTGATGNVDLGEYEIKVGQLELDQTPTGTAGIAVMRWNDQDGTADLGLKGGNVTLQIGQEQVTRVVNKTGVNLLEANYQAVRVDGAQGNRLKVALAQANNDANSADTLGLVTETINDNQEGFVTVSGLVRNINTTGSIQTETWLDGDVLYLSGTVAGQITNIKPAAPIHTVIMGYVVRAHATQGQIYVKVDNGYELDELHNVAITTPLNNQVLQYETATSLWKNKTISTGITIGTTAITSGTVGRVLFEGTGNVVQESANLFWDNTNGRLGIGTSSPTSPFTLIGASQFGNALGAGSIETFDGYYSYSFGKSTSIYNPNNNYTRIWMATSETKIDNFTGNFLFRSAARSIFGLADGVVNFYNQSNTVVSKFFSNTGNWGINTTTDAGFKLDVNGTARVSGVTLIGSSLISASAYPLQVVGGAGGSALFSNTTRTQALNVNLTTAGETRIYTDYFTGGADQKLILGTFANRANQLILNTTGNVLINTTTDAGYKLDVNGTARVQGTLTVSAGGAVIAGQLQANGGLKASVILNNTFNTNGNSATIFQSSDALGEARFYNSVCAGFVSTINASAILQAESTTKGFLPPRMTTTQKNAIAIPATGLMVYDTTLNVITYYNGTTWI